MLSQTTLIISFLVCYKSTSCVNYSRIRRFNKNVLKNVRNLNVEVHFNPGYNHINGDFIFATLRDDYISKLF